MQNSGEWWWTSVEEKLESLVTLQYLMELEHLHEAGGSVIGIGLNDSILVS